MVPIFGAVYAAPNIDATILYCFRSQKTLLNPPVNGKIQGLFKAFESFSKYLSRQILFSRTFQDSVVYSSTFQECANYVIYTYGACFLSQEIEKKAIIFTRSLFEYPCIKCFFTGIHFFANFLNFVSININNQCFKRRQTILSDTHMTKHRNRVKILKFRKLVACQKKPKQTGQTQIRLLLKKQSDQGIPCLLF